MGLAGKSVPANKVRPVTRTRVPSGAISVFAGGSLSSKPSHSASTEKSSSRQSRFATSGRRLSVSEEQQGSNGTDGQWDEYYAGTDPLIGSASTTSTHDRDTPQPTTRPPDPSMSTHTELFGMAPEPIQDFLNSVVSSENRSVTHHIDAPESWKGGGLQAQDLYHLLAFLISSYPTSKPSENAARKLAQTNLRDRADEAKSKYLELAQLERGSDYMEVLENTVWWADKITYAEIQTDRGLLRP